MAYQKEIYRTRERHGDVTLPLECTVQIELFFTYVESWYIYMLRIQSNNIYYDMRKQVPYISNTTTIRSKNQRQIGIEEYTWSTFLVFILQIESGNVKNRILRTNMWNNHKISVRNLFLKVTSSVARNPSFTYSSQYLRFKR